MPPNDSIDLNIDLRYTVLAIEGKIAQLDKDMAKNAQIVSELQNTAIRTDERIVVIQKYLNDMSADIRTVRNSILGAIITAVIVGVGSLAFTQTNTRTTKMLNIQHQTRELQIQSNLINLFKSWNNGINPRATV